MAPASNLVLSRFQAMDAYSVVVQKLQKLFCFLIPRRVGKHKPIHAQGVQNAAAFEG